MKRTFPFLTGQKGGVCKTAALPGRHSRPAYAKNLPPANFLNAAVLSPGHSLLKRPKYGGLRSPRFGNTPPRGSRLKQRHGKTRQRRRKEKTAQGWSGLMTQRRIRGEQNFGYPPSYRRNGGSKRQLIRLTTAPTETAKAKARGRPFFFGRATPLLFWTSKKEAGVVTVLLTKH